MEKTKEQQILCRSVFKSGESTTSSKQFTEKWMELVSTLEKRTNAVKRP